ncbi:MAG: EAL domain-containing protein [Gammaproteobacteria bacterium]|nr:EAL domain-containing protein [Gammaproteobacteria bacterium]MBU1775009.1 EAL domain-containing protein [Gammaproteobacteria bacterium]MBU1970113.1 EAL domain-containing protein [Gammaproteobacteria bacterium]
MRFRDGFKTVRPIVTALAVIASASVLVVAIYFTWLDLQWIAFLAGVLVTAILAEATRVSRLEWLASLRIARLAATREKLEHETNLRKNAEASIAANKSRLQLVDETIPTMIALIDAEGHCQYHNRALMEWLHLRPEHIHGQHIRKVLGPKVYQESATAIRQSLDGQPVHYERMQHMPDGTVYKLRIEHLPQFADDGKVTGFYMLMDDITSPEDLHVREGGTPSAPTGIHHPATDSSSTQDSFVDAFSEQVAGKTDVGQIRSAIENGAFQLFCQLISPLREDAGKAEHYEILVRLLEEEEGMMPPGAFFPLAEKYGLMPHLDRWVVQHVAQWAAHQHDHEDGKESMFFINVSGATLADPGFPEFLQLTLVEHGVPGSRFCFEITDAELAAKSAFVAEFARKVRGQGCRIAISCFGRDRISFDLIRGFRVDFLKIDGNIIFNILRDPVSLAKLAAISNTAMKIGVGTIAELVEDEETIAKLKEIGIDYAQGFGISRPRPLAE